jgi:simple sugar transport system ATP-binding protein
VRAIAHQTGFALDPDALVEALPVGAQQRVEIAKALARRARILVLDEPTAVLAPAEADDLLRWLRSYVMQGNAAVLSTHKLGEALAVADELTVLRQGRVVHRAARVDSSAELLTAAMIGESTWEPDAVVPVRSRPRPTRPMFSATQLTLCDEEGRVRLAGATFTIDSGELVGIAAVEGAGQRQLLRALAGRLDPAGGELVRPPVVGFVPEDRHHDAVLLERSLAENVALRGAGRRSGRVRWPAVRAHTESLMRAFDVRAPGARTSMRILSGGNQQKLVLARELDDGGDTEVRALIVENPTRGLDVRATADIHTRLRTARDRGTAVVVYSSDLDEVLGLASRVLVLYAGTLRESAPDRDTVGRAMLGLPL